MTIAFVRRSLAGGAVALIGALAACSTSTETTAPVGGAASASVYTMQVIGNNQTAPVNANISVRVRVLNSSGAAASNFLLNFVVTAGGGSVFAPAVFTDAAGYADEQWTLGPKMGTQTLQARQINSNTGALTDYGTVTAKATPPNNVLVVGNNSTGIFIMNANGSGFKQLTTGGRDTEPDLSPDHTKIVFFSKRHADSAAVFLMNANGTNIHQISTTMFEQDAGPQWSSNDSLIIYSGQPTGFNGCVSGSGNPCGSQQQVFLSDTLGHSVIAFNNGGGDLLINATWAANGNQYLYSFDGTDLGGLDLFLSCPAAIPVSPPNACEPTVPVRTQLTQGWTVAEAAASPDGSHIAMVGIAAAGTGYPGAGSGFPGVGVPGSGVYLFTMNADGTGITPLTSATGFGGFISYSPDGTIIAVDHGFINSDGTGYTVVNGCPCRFAWK